MPETIIQGGFSLYGLVVSGYDTIADLRSQPIADSPLWTKRSLAMTFGDTVALDGDFGFYAWDPTSVAADDGNNVIKPTAITGPGRWRLVGTTGGATGVCSLGENVCFGGECPNQVLSILNDTTGLYNRPDAVGADGVQALELDAGEECGGVSPTTFNCIEGECIDPGDGSGTYATLDQCEEACGEPLFGCCQEERQYYSPAYSTTSDRVGVAHEGPAGPNFVNAKIQVIQPECDGLAQLLNSRASGDTVWDPVSNKFFVGLQGGGPGGSDVIARFDPLTYAIDYIPFGVGSAFQRVLNARYIPSTQRIWFEMVSFSPVGAFLVLDPSDLSVVAIASALLNGVITDFTYCASEDMVYCTTGTGTKLVKVDPSTHVASAVATAAWGFTILNTTAIEYISDTQRLWIGFFESGAAPLPYGFAILDPSTDTLDALNTTGNGAPNHTPSAIWESVLTNRVLLQESAQPDFRSYATDATDVHVIADTIMQGGTKGIDVGPISKCGIAAIVDNQNCIAYFTEAELNPT